MKPPIRVEVRGKGKALDGWLLRCTKCKTNYVIPKEQQKTLTFPFECTDCQREAKVIEELKAKSRGNFPP